MKEKTISPASLQLTSLVCACSSFQLHGSDTNSYCMTPLVKPAGRS